jgi:hypothetical protein
MILKNRGWGGGIEELVISFGNGRMAGVAGIRTPSGGSTGFFGLLALGASTIVGVVRQKLEPPYAVPGNVRQKEDEEDVRTTLTVLNDKIIQPSAAEAGSGR